MQPDKIKQWLKPDEYDLTHDRYHCDLADVALKKQRDLLQKSLAACCELSEQRRVLMEKHEFIQYKNKCFYCPECGRENIYGHAPDCAWDAALKDVGGE